MTENEFPCRIGICKECIEYIQLIKKNQISENIWECPYCFYPNHINDFLALDSTPTDTIEGCDK